MLFKVIPEDTMTTSESADSVTWGRGKACVQMNETNKCKLQCIEYV